MPVVLGVLLWLGCSATDDPSRASVPVAPTEALTVTVPEPSGAPVDPTGPNLELLCADRCGDVWLDGLALACDDCRTGDALAEAMAPVDHALAQYAERSAMDDMVGVDAVAVRSHAEQALRRIPDADRATVAALNRVVQGYRNGHSGLLSLDGCDAVGGVDPWWSPHGGCLEPLDDHYVVTEASAALSLLPGDRVHAVNGRSGTTLVDHLADGPLCATGASTDDVRHELAAHVLLGSLQPGDHLEVERLDGTFVSVEVATPTESDGQWCGPDTRDWIDSYVRDDGVAVIRVSRWILAPGDPNYVSIYDVEDYDDYLEAMLSHAQEHFDAVTPGATGLVWDIRANGGGFTYTTLALAAGMPGAREGVVTRCVGRVPGSDPVAYTRWPLVYELVPDDRFAFDGPVAALFDGRSVSASDYFAYTLRSFTDVRLFGRPTAGAFGGSSAAEPLPGTDGLYLGVDGVRCDDADGVPLETRSVQPHEWVEPDPHDVAAGIDTVLERAASWVVLAAQPSPKPEREAR